MHAVRSDGGHPTRPSQRAMGTAGYALSRSGRRSDPPRRFYRKTFLTTLSSQLRLGSSPERGRIGRTIFVFLHLFDGLLWRDHPLEAAVFVHGAKNKRCVPRNQGKHRSHKISRIDRGSLLRLASTNVIQHFCKTLLAGTEVRDIRVIALDRKSTRLNSS